MASFWNRPCPNNLEKTQFRLFQTQRVCRRKFLNLQENGRKISKQVESTVGKGEIARLRAISPFPTVFSKDLYFRHVKTMACLVKGITCRRQIRCCLDYGVVCMVEDFFANFSISKNSNQGLYSPTILNNVLSLVLQFFLYLEASECNKNFRKYFRTRTINPFKNKAWFLRICSTSLLWKHCGKKKNALSFPVVFSTHLEKETLRFSSNLKWSSATLSVLEVSKICRLGKG